MTDLTVSEGCAWTTRVLEEVRTKKWRGGITGGEKGLASLGELKTGQAREVDEAAEVGAVGSSSFRLEGRRGWRVRSRASAREVDMRWNSGGE